MIRAVDKALKVHGLDTQISGVDETNAQTLIEDWAGLDSGAIAAIDQINVHSYDTTGKTGVRDVARATGKRLWMSEVDLSPPNVPQAFDDMRPAIALGEEIVSDMNRLEPVAWVLWQAVENETKPPARGSDWGLIKMDYADTVAPKVNITTKYWAMANFSRFIRPGARFLPVDDTDTVVAIGTDGASFTAVHVNPGLYARRVTVVPPSSRSVTDYSISTFVTDAKHQAQAVCVGRPLSEGGVIAPPRSITTIVFTPQSEKPPEK
jgi:O-glycosyl hydrolase